MQTAVLNKYFKNIKPYCGLIVCSIFVFKYKQRLVYAIFDIVFAVQSNRNE